ncbi:MAG: hypothetical protein PHT15_03710 [Gallionellaceae bacterium]|nr:hypothetical protein [Gallionellaceae bacterium]
MPTQNNAQATSAAPWLNEPTPLELLVDIVSGKKSSEYNGATRAFTVRIPIHNALLLDAMFANTNGISRNEFVCHLLDMALQEVREKLPEDVNEKILQYVSVQMDSSNDKILQMERTASKEVAE